MMEAMNYWQRRLSRRRVLKGAALGSTGLAAAAVIGCGQEETLPSLAPPGAATAPAPAPAQAKKGGTLRYNSFGKPYSRGLDPHVNQASHVGRMLLFYQTLLRANPRTRAVEPELAQKWEQPSPTELVLSLAPGVKFHNKPPANGREMRVEDVLFSLERVRTANPRFASRSLLDSVDKIGAVDASRLKLSLKLVDAGLLSNLTGPPLAVVAPEVVEKAGDRFATADTAVGTGPFVLTELTDLSATHVRNGNYWKAGFPHLDRVLTPALEDFQVRWAAFLGGQLDLVVPVLGTVAKKYVDQKGRFTIEGRFPAEWTATPGGLRLFINVKRRPFADKRVYKALRLLVNHDEMLKDVVEAEDGRGSLGQTFPPALADWDFTQEEYASRFLEWKRPKDEAAKAARDLLNAAGFTRDNPLKFTLTTQTGGRWAIGGPLLQSQWQGLSQGAVQLDMKLFDSAVIAQVTTNRDYEVLFRGILPAAMEPDTVFRSVSYTGGGFNWAQWSDPKADEIIDRQRATLDVQQRKALIKEILAYLIDNEPHVLLAGQYNLMASYPKVKDWAPEGDFSGLAHQYEQVWLDV